MPSRSRAGTLAFGVAVTLVLLLCLPAIGAGRTPAAPRTARSCPTTGLRYSEERGGATYGDAVADLRARGVSCADARSVASRVARDILRGSKVPKRIAGLKVTLRRPCAGCAPDIQVRARSGAKVVTFTVRGGA